MSNVQIVTGPVHTGKTTRLRNWIKTREAAGEVVHGVTAPIVNAERHIALLPSVGAEPSRSLTPSPGEPTVSIGPHVFSESVFAWARRHLIAGTPHGRSALAELSDSGSDLRAPQWIVIDEIGPLELRGEALEPAVSEVLRAARSPGGPAVVLVIRDRLLEKAIGHYGLGDSFSLLDV